MYYFPSHFILLVNEMISSHTIQSFSSGQCFHGNKRGEIYFIVMQELYD